jgi:hypothetical protein
MNADWFLEERGIRPDTLEAFGVRFVGNEVVFPYPTGDKCRYWDEDGKRQFRFTKGMRPSLFGPRPGADDTTLFLCEGETDAMRLWQELKDNEIEGVSVLGLGGVDTWRKLPDYEKKGLMSFETLLLILDNDDDYNTRSHVDKVAMDIRREFGVKRVQRLHLPESAKDVCEFFQQGFDLESLRLLSRKGKSVSRFTPLDLSATPPPVNWLLDGLVAAGDVTLVSGPSGIGKSWLHMALARAIADRKDFFLGRPLNPGNGRSLLIDEENPEDVVYDRMLKLGLRNHCAIRYIWNNGIRVDKIPDLLLEEALDFDPVLFVLDSLTRVHGSEENSAGDMAVLLNDCIRPLARETGAAVLLIHHHDKAGNGPRGSGDILASVDGALDVIGQPGEGQFTLRLTKSRRRLGGADITVKIKDTEEGVELESLYNNAVLF